MTLDHYQINADGTADVIIFSNWLITYLRMSGYDFGECDIKVVRNPFVKERNELAFVFCGFETETLEDGVIELKDKRFLELMQEFYEDRGTGGFIAKFRLNHRDTMDIICGKKKLEDDCYGELQLQKDDK